MIRPDKDFFDDKSFQEYVTALNEYIDELEEEIRDKETVIYDLKEGK